MNTTELIAEVRFAGQLPDSSQDYTDARIRTELTVTQRSIFAPSVVEAKSGALLKRFLQPTVAGT
ncbi:MAG TPA: hypothetical protein VFJ95_12915, partial [Gammaproteobacteria bacterium]|nr:hypothetical protein [Gammaproteobacteria bacterium]